MRLFWEVRSIHTTPSLERLCSSSDPVSREAHWLMPSYRFSNMCYIYWTCLDFVSWLRAHCVSDQTVRLDGHCHIDTAVSCTFTRNTEYCLSYAQFQIQVDSGSVVGTVTGAVGVSAVCKEFLNQDMTCVCYCLTVRQRNSGLVGA
jgi:hypothetical protein